MTADRQTEVRDFGPRGRDALAERTQHAYWSAPHEDSSEAFWEGVADAILGERGMFLTDPTEVTDFGLLDGLAAVVQRQFLTGDVTERGLATIEAAIREETK